MEVQHQPSGHCWYDKRCGSEECHRRYNQRAREGMRKKRRPDSTWNNPRVDGRETREHLLFLNLNGVSLRDIAKKTGLHYVHLGDVRSAKHLTVFKETEDKILALGTHMFPIKRAKTISHAKRFLRLHPRLTPRWAIEYLKSEAAPVRP